jgi:hypothetical protein
MCPFEVAVRIYISTQRLDHVQEHFDPINSELGLQHYPREMVENPAGSQRLADREQERARNRRVNADRSRKWQRL